MTKNMEWIDDVPPMFDGPAAKVWKFSAPEDATDDPRIAVFLDANFLIYAPGAHPFWDWHAMFAQTLEDVPGVQPAHRHYPGAEYEIAVVALEPDRPVPSPETWPFPGKIKIMVPADLLVHFHGCNREQALELVTLCAKAVSVGRLVPDSDHRYDWEQTIKKSAEHFRGHPEHN